MTDLTKLTRSPTASAIYAAYEARREGHRPHLGGSQIGHHCGRYLWLQFRWAASPSFDGRMLRLFDHGNHEEKRIVADLRAIGATVYEVDPDTGRQITYTAFCGHFGASLDGVAIGLPEAPHKWHVLEFKTSGDKPFQSLIKTGVEKDKHQHYSQMQIGMELAGIDRAMYIVINKNTDEIYTERVRHKPREAQRLLDRAARVIFSDAPLERVSDRPDWYQCRWCEARDVCHEGAPAEVNCRTCLHSTAERDGTWSCARHSKTLSTQDQRTGCDRHLYRPDMIAQYGEPTDAGYDWVEYGGWRNHCDGAAGGKHGYTSSEVRAADRMPLPDDVEAVRQRFGGTVEALKHGD
ncbi:MAG: oxidoreductase [Gammaproteobacteria bacterium]|nr:oxidoreductase [Gammaproteobacteria bacterium]